MAYKNVWKVLETLVSHLKLKIILISISMTVRLFLSIIHSCEYNFCCLVISSKALGDLHIDDLLEPEGYDTLPG